MKLQTNSEVRMQNAEVRMQNAEVRMTDANRGCGTARAKSEVRRQSAARSMAGRTQERRDNA